MLLEDLINKLIALRYEHGNIAVVCGDSSGDLDEPQAVLRLVEKWDIDFYLPFNLRKTCKIGDTYIQL